MLPLLLALAAPLQEPVVVVDRDDVRIEASCRVVVRADAIVDDEGDGVVHVVGDGAVVDLAGAHLRGAPAGVDPDAYEGVGIRIDADGVVLRGARVSGFRCGIRARGDGVVIEECDVSDNRRQRLRSTPAAEDVGDWLSPHANDDDEWLARYGAGIWVEESARPVVRRCRARDVQNGLVLDRVTGAAVYDNDLSFLSGWGIALWRSSECVVARNALDFCVRGYSHGVYNRGQDSAGLLVFEQCTDNVFAENSATHGGDGYFAFSGREALGEVPPADGELDYEGLGNARNVLVGNDLSYAAAHGIETTFSFDVRLVGNRLVENAICGVWGGYSDRLVVVDNELAGNGDAGYGLERGGVNVEHGSGAYVFRNRFRGNACGVHLWWDEDPHLADTPWARANGVASEGNAIVGNRLEGDEVAIHLRRSSGTLVSGNAFVDVGEEVRAEDADVVRAPAVDPSRAPEVVGLPEGLELPGETRPVGARAHLRGRERIVMTAWGPYDWEAPLLRLVEDAGGRHVWELLGEHEPRGLEAEGDVEATRDGRRVVVTAPAGRAAPYALRVPTDAGAAEADGLVVDAPWDVVAFAWTRDPREDLEGWRAEAAGGTRFRVPALALRYGSGGPADLPEAPADAALPSDRFGTLARTRVELPAGRWRLRVTSDDGVRVRADGRTVLEDWTWHPPRTATATLELGKARAVELEVEHFELDGWAVLAVAIERAP